LDGRWVSLRATHPAGHRHDIDPSGKTLAKCDRGGDASVVPASNSSELTYEI
jgi:hypothetical protein